MKQKVIDLAKTGSVDNIKLATTIGKNALDLSYDELYKMLLDNIDQDKVIESFCQDDICETCVINFYEGDPVNTNQYNLCEGSRCEDANEVQIDNFLDQLIDEA